MKIIKIQPVKEIGTFNNKDRFISTEFILFYKLIIKAKCGNHRIDIYENKHPRLFEKIHTKQIRSGQYIVDLLETVI